MGSRWWHAAQVQDPRVLFWHRKHTFQLSSFLCHAERLKSADPGQRKGERAREERCLEQQQQRRRRRRPPSTGAKAAKMLGFSWLSEGPFGTLSRFEAFIKVALRLPFCGFSGWTWGYFGWLAANRISCLQQMQKAAKMVGFSRLSRRPVWDPFPF